MRATLLRDNPDIAAILDLLCRLATISLDCVDSEQEILLAAHQARPGDFLIMDCSRDRPDAVDRGLRIITHTDLPVYIVHPREDFVHLLHDLSLGSLTWLSSDIPAASTLTKFRLLQVTAAAEDVAPDAVRLSEREHEVLRLAGDGLSDAAIAREEHLSPSTIKTHIRTIKDKLGVSTREQLIALYRQTQAS